MTGTLAQATFDKPIVVGRYEVTGLVGRGGMGSVYAATDREHGTQVALKTLTHLSGEGLLRFKNEFRSVASLTHPNLVPLYELACHDNQWFFTMERIEGLGVIEHLRGVPSPVAATMAASPRSRSRALEAGAPASRENVRSGAAPTGGDDASASAGGLAGPIDIAELRRVFRQLVEGVRALHTSGLLHLDLKPSNVMVARDGKVVVLDFGLVRAIEGAHVVPSDEDNIAISGTPAWMAPEQYLGSGIGEAADWYAVGMMLYLALTGEPAFAPSSVAVNWYAKLHHRPTPPHELLPDLPSDLSALAMALLDPDPGSRPSGETLEMVMSADPARRDTAARSLRREEIVGRDEERAALAGALAHVRGGGTAVVHVRGSSGVGKTALVSTLRTEAREARALVLRGRCYERETLPYKAFDGIVDGLVLELSSRSRGEVRALLPRYVSELCAVFPVLGRVPAIGETLQDATLASITVMEMRRRAVESLCAMVRSLAAQRPLVLEIDDLQWADEDSVGLLTKLLEAPAPAGLLVAISARPDEGAQSAAADYLGKSDALAARADLRFVSQQLGPLRFDAAQKLAAQTLGALGLSEQGVADNVAREAGGVPFFVEELAHYVAERRHDDGSAQVIDAGSVTLEDVLSARVRALTHEERTLVEVLAVANSPVPLTTAFRAASIDKGVLRALWSLSGGHFVQATGPSAEDRVELRHDRMREAVLRSMSDEQIEGHHLALGRALAQRASVDESGAVWLFAAARHLGAASARLCGEERVEAIRLHLEAGRHSRATTAFTRAYQCFSAGAAMLPPDAWETHYELALGLHGGAAEAAYLSSEFGAIDPHVAAVKAKGANILDQLVAREAEIDAAIATTRYVDAVQAALDALAQLDALLPGDPSEAEVGAELEKTMAALAKVGPEGLLALRDTDDPKTIAAMRIQMRISSASYFARPALFPVIACRLVRSSIEQGLCYVTPYALAVYGIVLNALGMHEQGHTWGEVAIQLLERFDNRSLEARTRHVVFNLVCVWTVPLAGTLPKLRRAVEIGKEIGDLEYVAYAAHAYVHNAFYASTSIDEVATDAGAFGTLLRGYEEVNALHVHEPFERVLACFRGDAADPASLDGGSFSMSGAIERAERVGSRSAQAIVRLLAGMVRYHFGDASEASAILEQARPFLDGVTSTWHIPVFHQYAALAIASMPTAKGAALVAEADQSLEVLESLSKIGPANFAHKAALVRAERARVAGRNDEARACFEEAVALAQAGGFLNDLGLASELAARFERACGGEPSAHHERAVEAYSAWGAKALVSRLAGKGPAYE